ncbi:MAG: alpha/beta hydrolase [Rhodospirillales bacterium]|nr:alpha/beta hydrolase [Rhodospirillales bacterium]
MPMTENSILGLGPHGFHRVAYFEWGDPKNPRVLICVHGLTRRGRDFDHFARAMEDRYRVVCVDLPGRGSSDWLPLAAGYQPATYIQDMAALIARLGVEQVDWLGVSLGGLMGMMLAAQPKTPIRKLVVDDIGGYVGVEALQRIASYVGQDPIFPDREGLEAYMREVNVGYGPLTDAQWAHIIEHGHRVDETGQWRQHYDPKLAEPFKAGFSEPVSLWPLWDAIASRVLILRGALSEILTRETADEMVARKPGTTLIEFQGVGHAPMLMADDQVTAVRDWLG